VTPDTLRRRLGNGLGTPSERLEPRLGAMGTIAALSWHRRWHGGGTPRRDAGAMHGSIVARTRAGHAVTSVRVLLRSQTGGMQASTISAEDSSVTACYRAAAAATAFPWRSQNVPEGGRTGGFQTSAPQVRPLALPDTAAASHGHDGGTVVAPDTFGPTAHKSVSSLLVLLYRCFARPSWTDR
jgi:hypothetical protein